MVDSTLIYEINESTKPILKIKPRDMTPEERKERKKLLQRDYMREYMKKRREDPEFAEKVRKITRESKRRIYNENAEVRQRTNEKAKERYKLMSDAYKMACQ